MSQFRCPRDYWMSPGGPVHCARENRYGPDYVRAGHAGARAAGGALHPFDGLGKFELLHAWAVANSYLQTQPDPAVRFDVRVQKRRAR